MKSEDVLFISAVTKAQAAEIATVRKCISLLSNRKDCQTARALLLKELRRFELQVNGGVK